MRLFHLCTKFGLEKAWYLWMMSPNGGWSKTIVIYRSRLFLTLRRYATLLRMYHVSNAFCMCMR